MGQRHVRKMLRKMAGGQPVEVEQVATLRSLALMAAVAEQFGYAYADTRQRHRNGPQMFFVPDPHPQARERAERNRVRYPDAATGGALPPVPADVLELFKARISYDLEGWHTDKQRTMLLYLVLTVLCVILGVRLGLGGTSPTVAATVAAVAWAALMAVTLFLVSVRRRKRARFAAILEAAGFTQTTEQSGRERYLPLTYQ
ncbi:hypothetical protein [Micromonospora narathiwatensis]|uniref:Integral membrane protein n=1 Tax=Micromonospora narathiwatensis TaxID=299146 RepID=A0A1A8ZYN4_9ACTN|nr:hypothetical protein [Micromonospora narathiwatensis]SBT48996.1 hypothetical protein GA0070621_3324 [Micromonospora narathiwatensis]